MALILGLLFLIGAQTSHQLLALPLADGLRGIGQFELAILPGFCASLTMPTWRGLDGTLLRERGVDTSVTATALVIAGIFSALAIAQVTDELSVSYLWVSASVLTSLAFCFGRLLGDMGLVVSALTNIVWLLWCTTIANLLGFDSSPFGSTDHSHFVRQASLVVATLAPCVPLALAVTGQRPTRHGRDSV